MWLHNGEDGQEELTRRICAICEYYKIPQEELDGWLAVTSGADMPLKVANGFSDLKIDASLVEEMTATVLEGEIDVVLLDPLVTLHSINESDNGKMDAVIRIFGRMADVCGCAVDLSHHTRKGPAGSSGDHTSDDARGASAIRDAVRMMRVLNIMSKEDASSLGLDEFARLSYFRVDRGKANTVPPAKSATWRKFESVHLANDDDVGVVAPWDHPDAEAARPRGPPLSARPRRYSCSSSASMSARVRTPASTEARRTPPHCSQARRRPSSRRWARYTSKRQWAGCSTRAKLSRSPPLTGARIGCRCHDRPMCRLCADCAHIRVHTYSPYPSV